MHRNTQELERLHARIKPKAMKLLREDCEDESRRVGGSVALGVVLSRILFKHYGVEDSDPPVRKRSNGTGRHSGDE